MESNLNKSKIFLAAGLLFASAGAFAQSSVTLFGSLDEGLNYTNNVGGKHAFQMASIDLVTSRWGLKGTEDLGGGLHALFDLESGFNMESGQAAYGGRLFGYQSYVGLASDSFGTLTVGRQFDTVADTIAPLTANGNWVGYLFSHPIDNDNTDATFHASNSVKYTSTAWNGLTGTATYGFSNQPGGFAQNRMYGVGLKYTHDTLNVAAVYEDLSHPGTTGNGALAADDTGFVAGNQKIYGIGAGYGIGPATVNAVYTHVNLDDPSASGYIGSLGTGTSSLKFDNIEANLQYNLTSALFVGGMYTYTRARFTGATGESSMHWNQVGLMAQYNLSKRTGVYAQAVYQKVSAGNTGTALDYAYIPGSAGVSSTTNQVVGRVAITHTF